MEESILERTRAALDDQSAMDLFQRIVFFIASKAGTISHTVPHYTAVLERGVLDLIAEAAVREATTTDAVQRYFYQAMQCALQGIVDYAGHLAEEARRQARYASGRRRAELLELDAICRQVPAHPARTFREAINSLWLLQVAIHAENINMAISPGRLDQILYPWYRADLEAGRLDVAGALELVGCLWLKLNDNTNLVPETAEELFGGAGTVPAVTLGGVDAEGRDAVNDLTYVMLRATELLKLRDPSVNARYHYEANTRPYRDRVSQVIAETKAVPAFYNDVAAIATLENQGVATEDARDWAVIGCVELGVSGRSYDASSSIILNLVSALELALYNGKRPVTGDEQIGPITGDPAGFDTFEQFRDAYQTQLGWMIEQAIGLNEEFGKIHQQWLPTPLLSALFVGPMETGRDLVRGGARYNSSGATHVGFADAVDSLAALEAAVFTERRCTFAELFEALEADFENQAGLHAWLVHRAPKYGTSDPAAAGHAAWLVDFLYDIYQAHTNYRGGRYRPAYWTMTNHAGQGRLTGALPNGRRAHKPFASGITPVSQATFDLAECLHAVGSLDARHIPGGEALNLKFPAVAGTEDITRLGGAVEGYFRTGGLHVQFNMMSYEMLLDARDHPEDYPDLLVRVSGYSAYFNDLNDAMKEEIITRTAYDLRHGNAVPFPEEHRAMLAHGEAR
jgi:formate C-acetyltransferase